MKYLCVDIYYTYEEIRRGWGRMRQATNCMQEIGPELPCELHFVMRRVAIYGTYPCTRVLKSCAYIPRPSPDNRCAPVPVRPHHYPRKWHSLYPRWHQN